MESLIKSIFKMQSHMHEYQLGILSAQCGLSNSRSRHTKRHWLEKIEERIAGMREQLEEDAVRVYKAIENVK